MNANAGNEFSTAEVAQIADDLAQLEARLVSTVDEFEAEGLPAVLQRGKLMGVRLAQLSLSRYRISGT